MDPSVCLARLMDEYRQLETYRECHVACQRDANSTASSACQHEHVMETRSLCPRNCIGTRSISGTLCHFLWHISWTYPYIDSLRKQSSDNGHSMGNIVFRYSLAINRLMKNCDVLKRRGQENRLRRRWAWQRHRKNINRRLPLRESHPGAGRLVCLFDGGGSRAQLRSWQTVSSSEVYRHSHRPISAAPVSFLSVSF